LSAGVEVKEEIVCVDGGAFTLSFIPGLKTADAKYGERIALVPARRAHEVVKLLLDLYKSDKQGEENFARWTDRKGTAFFKEKTAPFQDLDAAKAANPKIFEDLGDDGVAFKVSVGKGECAA